MSAREPGGITLERWFAVADDLAGRLYTDMDVPIWLRVLYAALYRMNALGHAEFGSGELAELIGTSATAGSLRAAIRKLKALGFIGDESTARCIVLHHGYAQRGRGSKSCRTHRLGEHKDKRIRIRSDRKVPRQGEPVVDRVAERRERADQLRADMAAQQPPTPDPWNHPEPEPVVEPEPERASRWHRVARETDSTTYTPSWRR